MISVCMASAAEERADAKQRDARKAAHTMGSAVLPKLPASEVRLYHFTLRIRCISFRLLILDEFMCRPETNSHSIMPELDEHLHLWLSLAAKSKGA